MSVIIIGGNEGMSAQYKKVCKEYNFAYKQYFKMPANNMKNKIGKPDLVILFTSTISHKLLKSAISEADKNSVRVEKVQNASATALRNILENFIFLNNKLDKAN